MVDGAKNLPCACTSLRKAARAVSRLYDEALLPTGLTTPQLAILRDLGRGGDQALSRLAEAMVMDRTSLYRALGPMIRAGWVRVQPGVKGRTKIAGLTAEGARVMDAAAPQWEAAQARFVGAFGPEAWAMLHDVLQGVIKSARAATA